jgi:FG-GAP-like repeat
MLGQPAEHPMQLTGRTVAGSVRAAYATRPIVVARVRGGRFWPRLALTVLLVAVSFALAPSTAVGAACPSLDTSWTGNCGPTFAVPNWTDAGGWTDPSKYSTIQLADVNGDGRDELLARNDRGLEIYWFDTSLGQWRPQVDGNGVQQVLTDFASPVPSESPATDWTKPEYYSTIQAADIDGQPGAEILARFSRGMSVYKYAPPAGGRSDGGTWNRIGTGGPFSDADGYDDPSLYLTIRVGQFNPNVPPLLFARQHSTSGDPTLRFFTFGGSVWQPVQGTRSVDIFTDQNCSTPSCYLILQTANLPPDGLDLTNNTAEVVGRTAVGVSAWDLASTAGDWNWFTNPSFSPYSAPFTDQPGGQAQLDCPFSNDGATGPGSGDCLGSSPSYYETLQTANVIPPGYGPGDELLARTSDGLRVRRWTCCFGPGWWPWITSQDPLPALGGAPSALQPGEWGSIRTGDIDGDGTDEVLALDGKALQAWSNLGAFSSFTWKQLQPSTPLALAGDPWLSHPEYYSTIQTGDVDGDKRDDVVARGPSGIRTWFYDRRGTGGWERYLPEGYPAFPSAGQQAAFTALTALAKSDGVIPETAASVRDVWSSENAPQASDLQQLQQGLVSIANCTGPGPGNPPSFQACTPPAGSSGFAAADWTAVVNEMLAEIYAAVEVVNFFAQLESMRTSLFIAEGAELPAIGSNLGLQAAAGSTTQFDALELWSVVFGIAGSLASVGSPAAGAPLSVASYLLSAIASSSQTAVSSFFTTYAGLQNQFAQMASEVDKAMLVQSQQVRQDAGLLGLVGQLRSRGTWALDAIGIASAANQGFATWVYRALMPTIYDRWQVTNCFASPKSTHYCVGASGTGVIGNSNNFTTIGLPPTTDSFGLDATPCTYQVTTGDYDCRYDSNSPPADLMSRIWGPVAPTCLYQPGNAQTAWTFGCSAGVDVNTSIGQNGWGFTSYHRTPAIDTASAQLAAARDGRRAPIVLGRPRVGRRRAGRGRAYLRADVSIPRSVRLAGATVTLDRLLFERGGHGELTRPRGGRAPRPLKLRRTSAGRFAAGTTGRPRVRLVLRRVDRGARVALRLRIGAPAFRTPRVCHALPAAIALDTPPLELQSRLRISDGRTRRLVRLTHPVRCVRDRRGNMDRLVPVRPRRHRSRGGLAVTLRGPRRVRPGTTARYVARVHNRRRGNDRLRSSLWDVTLAAFRGRRTRISELRRGRSHSVTFTRRVPRTARRRFCVDVVATAAGARPASARVCVPIRAARALAATGDALAARSR